MLDCPERKNSSTLKRRLQGQLLRKSRRRKREGSVRILCERRHWKDDLGRVSLLFHPNEKKGLEEFVDACVKRKRRGGR